MTEIVLVLTTTPDDGRAEALAAALVGERLAACVNVHGPMRSTYRWKEQVETDAERQLVIKTTRERVTALESRVHELHPYELPELVVIPVEDGSAPYLNWVANETQSRS